MFQPRLRAVATTERTAAKSQAASKARMARKAAKPSVLLVGQDFDAILAALEDAGVHMLAIVKINDAPNATSADRHYENWIGAHPTLASCAEVATDQMLLMMHSSGT